MQKLLLLFSENTIQHVMWEAFFNPFFFFRHPLSLSISLPPFHALQQSKCSGPLTHIDTHQHQHFSCSVQQQHLISLPIISLHGPSSLFKSPHKHIQICTYIHKQKKLCQKRLERDEKREIAWVETRGKSCNRKWSYYFLLKNIPKNINGKFI